MTLDEATAAARRRARRSGQHIHIFLEQPDDYQIGSDYDADTYFLGTPPVATVLPDGEVMTPES